jgi:hypothetical protein
MNSSRLGWSTALVALSVATVASGCGQSSSKGSPQSSENGSTGGPSGTGGGSSTAPGGGSSQGTASGTGKTSGTASGTATGSASGTASGSTTTAGADDSVLMLHAHVSRDGAYVQPALTKTEAATMHKDTTMAPTVIQGAVYAQPLYVQNGPNGKGIFIVVTASNNVYALSETDGSQVWKRTIGTAATQSGAGCGNIKPLGIVGTPAIDLPSRTMYLSAAVATTDGSAIKTHEIHAVSIDDGTEKAGFPVDTSKLAADGITFNPVVQNQRGALLVENGTLYVPYGGHAGDCGQYRGWVMGVPLANAAGAMAFATMAKAGGIWAVGGLASDGTDVFATTGNTYDIGQSPPPTIWGQGDAVLRFNGLPTLSNATKDYFYPSNWASLDVSDGDLGGTGAVPIDVAGATPSALLVALGKNGVAYLLNRANLGGKGTGNGTTGEGLTSKQVASAQIMNAPTTYTTANGTYVAFVSVGMGTGCPSGQMGNLVALKIGAASPPTINVAWCASLQGRGSPIMTTTDGSANPIVWAFDSGANRLKGFDADTGAAVFTGGGANDTATGAHYFNSPIAAKGRIIVAVNNGLVAFTGN